MHCTCTPNLNVHVSIIIKTKYLLICFLNICGSCSVKHLFRLLTISVGIWAFSNLVFIYFTIIDAQCI